MTALGQSAVIDPRTKHATLVFEPPLTSPPLTVLIEGPDGARVEQAADWSGDYLLLGLPPYTPLEELLLDLQAQTPDLCFLHVTTVRAGGTISTNDTPYSVTPCGPFGMKRFVMETGRTPCAAGEDCTGFIELLADGTLRVDRMDEPGVVHEATISTSELGEAKWVLQSPNLLLVLDATEPPCPQPPDMQETMELELPGGTLRNATASCTQGAISEARELMERLAAAVSP